MLKQAAFFAMLPALAHADAVNVQYHVRQDAPFTTVEVYLPETANFEFSAFADRYAGDTWYGETYLYYNGLGDVAPTFQTEFGDFGDVALFGLRWKGAEALYRDDGHVQFTYVWNQSWGKVSVGGYLDVWDGKASSQPQFWYALTKHLAIGSEIDIWKDTDGTTVVPSLALKVTFQ